MPWGAAMARPVGTTARSRAGTTTSLQLLAVLGGGGWGGGDFEEVEVEVEFFDEIAARISTLRNKDCKMPSEYLSSSPSRHNLPRQVVSSGPGRPAHGQQSLGDELLDSERRELVVVRR